MKAAPNRGVVRRIRRRYDAEARAGGSIIPDAAFTNTRKTGDARSAPGDQAASALARRCLEADVLLLDVNRPTTSTFNSIRWLESALTQLRRDHGDHQPRSHFLNQVCTRRGSVFQQTKIYPGNYDESWLASVQAAGARRRTATRQSPGPDSDLQEFVRRFSVGKRVQARQANSRKKQLEKIKIEGKSGRRRVRTLIRSAGRKLYRSGGIRSNA